MGRRKSRVDFIVVSWVSRRRVRGQLGTSRAGACLRGGTGIRKLVQEDCAPEWRGVKMKDFATLATYNGELPLRPARAWSQRKPCGRNCVEKEKGQTSNHLLAPCQALARTISLHPLRQ